MNDASETITVREIHPTGSCFDDAMEFFDELAKGFDDDDEARRAFDAYVLVHGICLFPDDHPEAGRPYAHAWVEDLRDDTVIQRGVFEFGTAYFHMHRSDFTAHYRPVKSTRYFPEEFARENLRTGHFGPWLPVYASLCRKKQL